MAEITVQWDDVKPGDKIVERSAVYGALVVERTVTRPENEKTLWVDRKLTSQSIARDNGLGYWHLYELKQGTGLPWDEFCAEFDVTRARGLEDL